MPNPLNEQFKFDEAVYQSILHSKMKGEPVGEGADPYDNKLWKEHRAKIQRCLKLGLF